MTGGDEESVTVVLPTYESVSSVVAAIESVRSQTRPANHVIVVDDGSTDGTAELVAERFPEVELVRQANAGPAAARNAGWRRARTRWVAFLDADDTFEPTKLETQLAVAAGRLSPVLVASDWVGAGVGIEPLGGQLRLTVLGYRDVLLLNRFQTSTVLLRRDVLEATGGFDSSLDGTEDWDLWLRCTRHGSVVKIDRPLVRYLDTPASYSKDGVRVRNAMRGVLARELPISSLAPRERAEVRVWHELRFVVSFALRRRFDLVSDAFHTLRSEKLLAAVPVAAVRYLIPYLVRRRIRRVRRVQPLRVRPAGQSSRLAS